MSDVWQPSTEQPEPSDGLRRLWAPWRSAYITGDISGDGCPFCELPARSDDRKSLIVYRGAAAYVVLNAYPYNPGHLMVVPFAHVADLEDLEAEAGDELWTLARRAVQVVRDRLRSDGVNLGANLGESAGAGVADHLHLHVVPRWSGDTNFVSVTGTTRVLSRALEEVYDDLTPDFG